MTDTYINIKGSLLSFDRPRVMGIVNITPDSFFAESRYEDSARIRGRVKEMISEGADIIDLGGYSTRPGAKEVSADEEFTRLARALEIIRHDFPDAIISIDTFRASVAADCIDHFGADIINDISGGTLDPEIQDVAASRGVPYVLMHMRGTPETMQSMTDYSNVAGEVIEFLARGVEELHSKGVTDVILDPGFGFAKDLHQNFDLLASLPFIKDLGLPVLVGLSRKSMVCRPLATTPDKALNGTTALNTIALNSGADILRVHDVKAAREAITLVSQFREAKERIRKF